MTRLVRWSPVRDFAGMRAEIDRMFGEFGSLAPDTQVTRWTPAMDVAEAEDGFTLTLDLPGLRSEDVDVNLDRNVLTVTGERSFEEEKEGTSYHRVERSYGKFQRSLTLPRDVEADGIEAAFDNGVLTISIPKAATAKPRKIEVGASRSIDV
ncbi:MAG TPA: Hsp20/alpha crystallin family protein [Actinomycetota bacterium]